MKLVAKLPIERFEVTLFVDKETYDVIRGLANDMSDSGREMTVEQMMLGMLRTCVNDPCVFDCIKPK